MNGQQVVDRIGFAERWLDRAKRQCEGGDVSRGMLTLVLANAEMTHALRLAHQEQPSRRRWVWGAAFAAACSLALGAVGWQRLGPAPMSSTGGPIVVTLNHQPGVLLRLIDVAPSQMTPTAGAQAVRDEPSRRPRSTASARRRLGGGQRIVLPMPQASAAYARSVPQGQRATPPSSIVSKITAPPTAQMEETSIASDVELINLVLTAERTLRTQSRP